MFREIEEKLSIFKNVYDVIRVIDPISKRVIYINESKGEVIEGKCHGFWDKKPFCENCISMRAYLENDTFVKIENKKGKVFLVTATPAKINDNTYVIEILKDISKSGSFSDKYKNDERAMALLTQEMNNKIVTDDLTRVYNRRYINERLPIDMNNSSINGQPIAIVMADIDLFKNVNDVYGHVIGDKVIRDFAKLIKTSIRKHGDWVGRYGGEEFLIVLNNTHPEDAYNIAEGIRKRLEQISFNYDGIDVRITSSFGVYGMRDINLNFEGLISSADKNLYEAKQLGRNKTVSNK